MSKIGDYIRETKGEMRHVNWPTRRQAIAFTSIVIGITLAFAIFLGAFDFLFTFGIEQAL